MKLELSRTYNPRDVESRWYAWWESQGYFRADATSKNPPFTIVIPPPNVTGALHMGHMLSDTIQDVIVRRRRMQGFNTLWLPGMDHAGIATQNVVERQLAEEGKTRFDLGREKFVERVWAWKETSGGMILKQIRRIGGSCDWSRERFTLDEGLSRAVREVFVRLYEEGLIYRGKRLINWCPRCRTALSDLETKHQPVSSALYHYRYPVKDGGGAFVEVATTRPETMLGDTAVAVHPDDARYHALRGKTVLLPLMNREIPIVDDTAVDPKFGTGAVKVTPAHDPVDFEIAQRHKLPAITVIGEDATITAEGGVYKGLDRKEARQRVHADLEALGLVAGVETFTHNVGHCDRCGSVVEPLISTQWFVRIAPLAEPAIRAVEEGRVRFVPSNWSRTYLGWMNNIRDWCISRQLWWGHRIPVWYCDACGEVHVSRTDVVSCSKCGSSNLRQDPDVLDTWFSSGLWPFSTLGWPDETDDLKTFYPGSVLVTGYEIIFLWVARMIMLGLKFRGDVPFRDVHIHGIVRDAGHQKMSKSKGNVVDPLEICDKYGTDAVRFGLLRRAGMGSDISFSEEQIESYRAFATKIWNAARLVFTYIGENDQLPPADDLRARELSLADRWILSRLRLATEEVNRNLDQYLLHEAGKAVYQFFWSEFCSWYLEMIKLDPERSKTTLIYVFESALRLLHPFMPFITEELWQNTPHVGESIVIAPFPRLGMEFFDERAESSMGTVQEIVTTVRNIRAEKNVETKSKVPLRVATTDPETVALLGEAREYIFKLAGVSQLDIVPALSGGGATVQGVAAGLPLEVSLEGLLDVNAERARLTQGLEKARKEIDGLERKLSNASFVERAPKLVVEENRQRLEEYRDQASKLMAAIERLA
jgi:valyl-tRNA synthetase